MSSTNCTASVASFRVCCLACVCCSGGVPQPVTAWPATGGYTKVPGGHGQLPSKGSRSDQVRHAVPDLLPPRTALAFFPAYTQNPSHSHHSRMPTTAGSEYAVLDSTLGVLTAGLPALPAG